MRQQHSTLSPDELARMVADAEELENLMPLGSVLLDGVAGEVCCHVRLLASEVARLAGYGREPAGPVIEDWRGGPDGE